MRSARRILPRFPQLSASASPCSAASIAGSRLILIAGQSLAGMADLYYHGLLRLRPRSRAPDLGRAARSSAIALGDGDGLAFRRARRRHCHDLPKTCACMTASACSLPPRPPAFRLCCCSARKARAQQCRGDALGDRCGSRRARSLRPHRAGALAREARSLPQWPARRMVGGVESCRVSFPSGCRAGRSCAF